MESVSCFQRRHCEIGVGHWVSALTTHVYLSGDQQASQKVQAPSRPSLTVTAGLIKIIDNGMSARNDVLKSVRSTSLKSSLSKAQIWIGKPTEDPDRVKSSL